MATIKRLLTREWWLIVITLMALLSPLHYLFAYCSTPAGYRFLGGVGGDDYLHYTLMRFWEGYYQNPWTEEEIDSIFYSGTFVYVPLGYVAKLFGVEYIAFEYVSRFLFAFLYLYIVYYALKRFSSSPREHALSFLFFTLLNGLGGFSYLVYRLITDPVHIAIPIKPFAGMKQVITYEMGEGTGLNPFTQLGRVYHLVPLLLGYLALYTYCTKNPTKLRSILTLGTLWGLVAFLGGPTFAFGFGIIFWLYAISRWDMKTIKALLASTFIAVLGSIPWYFYITGNRCFFNEYIRTTYHAMPWAIVVSIGPHVATSIYHVVTEMKLKRKRLSLGERIVLLLGISCLLLIAFYVFSLRDLGNLKYQYLSFWPVLTPAILLIARRLDVAKVLKKLRSNKDFTFLCLWALTMFVTSIWYARFAFWLPVRHLHYLWFPIVVLSAKGVSSLIERYDSMGNRKLFMKTLVAFIVLTFPSFIFYNVFFAYSWVQGASNKSLYATTKDFQAMRFLATQEPGRALSSPVTGSYLPYYSNQRTMLQTNPHITADSATKEEAIIRFYKGQMIEEQMYRFLSGYNLVYLFWGRNEKESSGGNLDLESVPFLGKIYDNGETQVFRFIQGD